MQTMTTMPPELGDSRKTQELLWKQIKEQGHLPLGLKLVDSLVTVSSTSVGVRIEMEKAVLAGHIARQVTGQASTRDAEEAVVCSLLHGLGRMVVAFYLPHYWEAIKTLTE